MPAPGRSPRVVFSQANNGIRFQSFFLMEALASHGFVVVAPDHAGNTATDLIFPGTPFETRDRPVEAIGLDTACPLGAKRWCRLSDSRRSGPLAHSPRTLVAFGFMALLGAMSLVGLVMGRPLDSFRETQEGGLVRVAVRSFASSLIFLAASLTAGTAAAQDEMRAAAVEGIAATIATVQDVDQETREITLRDPDGTLRTIVAGDEVRNFAQVKKGDVVLTEFYQGFAVALAPKGSGIEVRRDAVSAARAEPGEKPAAVVTRTIDAVAVVEAVDRESRIVTVQGAENTLILKAADDVDLDSVEVGQEVVASYVAAYAIAVVPSPKVSGNLAIESKAVALGVGIGWGSGTFTMYDGSVHELKVSGISFGDVGISSVELSGEVYQLTDPKDLAGPYVAATAGASMGKGVSNIVLRNPKGVVMHLESKQKGARLTLASAGVNVELLE